jgi:hypothetical protein
MCALSSSEVVLKAKLPTNTRGPFSAAGPAGAAALAANNQKKISVHTAMTTNGAAGGRGAYRQRFSPGPWPEQQRQGQRLHKPRVVRKDNMRSCAGLKAGRAGAAISYQPSCQKFAANERASGRCKGSAQVSGIHTARHAQQRPMPGDV